MCKLLMIDDNHIEHLIMQRMLESYKLFNNTEHSLSAKVVIDDIKKNSSDADNLPDIIFLDLQMPEFNGWDFLNKFKKLYPLLKKKIDVFILSSSINPEDELKTQEYPFVKAFFSKPMKKDTLINLYLSYKL